MTDSELLKLAAKAAGLCVAYYNKKGPMISRAGGVRLWNPLADDGDALRLAVKLHFAISWTTCFVQVGYLQEEYLEGKDEAAATRRAIVGAAAAIGKATP